MPSATLVIALPSRAARRRPPGRRRRLAAAGWWVAGPLPVDGLQPSVTATARRYRTGVTEPADNFALRLSSTGPCR